MTFHNDSEQQQHEGWPTAHAHGARVKVTATLTGIVTMYSGDDVFVTSDIGGSVTRGDVECDGLEVVSWEYCADDNNDTATAIVETCNRIRDMLLAKNRAYGDSALNPVRVFSRASTVEQLLVRIDDKLSRFARGEQGAFGDNDLDDLLGYLVLLKIARDKGQQ